VLRVIRSLGVRRCKEDVLSVVERLFSQLVRVQSLSI
jgi:hypothetical protein